MERALGDLTRAPWVAADTEADSLHHFREKLCLIQISGPERDYVIDPLAPVDLSGLAAALADKVIVFHGADFDVRMLRRVCDLRPQAIFDTLIAAQLLGYPKQGYADLAERHCGVRLSKAAQKADWSRRPLAPDMLEYAANDTHHLGEIRFRMEEELRAAGRLEWHRQNCARLLDALLTERPEPEDELPPWQIKGSKDLPPRGLTALRELWMWRDEVAQKKDRPRFKVLHSETLIELCKFYASAAWKGDAGECPKAPSNVRGEYRRELNACFKRADAAEPVKYQYPPKTPRKKWSNADSSRLSALKTERQRLAADLGLQPSLVATNAVLEDIASLNPSDIGALASTGRLLPWQVEQAGEAFLSALRHHEDPRYKTSSS
ncbi:MAG: Ribonuclease D [Candidatus Omnitrophica bacterium]|nr:Ribonuclease D [Candidatus Omnitrophota bacterium]